MSYLIVDEFTIYKATEITQEMRDVVEGGMASVIDTKTMKQLDPDYTTSGKEAWVEIDDSIY